MAIVGQSCRSQIVAAICRLYVGRTASLRFGIGVASGAAVRLGVLCGVSGLLATVVSRDHCSQRVDFVDASGMARHATTVEVPSMGRHARARLLCRNVVW